jgi:hypothetical protein
MQSQEEILVKKTYPHGFPEDVVKTLKNMSFTDGKTIKLMGTMPLRSQLYAGDYDAFEYVDMDGDREKAVHNIVEKFKSIVRNTLKQDKTYIADIKCGSVDDWIVVDEDYDHEVSLKKLKELYRNKIITIKEYLTEKKLLKPVSELKRLEVLYVRHEIRHNIIRWKPSEILKGFKILVDGRKFTLEEAVQSRTMTKMDVVSWVQNNRFTDFSCIYVFRNNGNILNVPLDPNAETSIRDNMYVLKSQGNYFKMAKRLFALAKIQKKRRIIENLAPLFNSDAGRMYHVYGDIGTIESLLENNEEVPYSALKLEIDQFKGRLSNVGLSWFLENESKILKSIEKAESRKTMEEALKELKEKLYELMSRYAKVYLLKKGLMRLQSTKTRRENKRVLNTTLKNVKFGADYYIRN